MCVCKGKAREEEMHHKCQKGKGVIFSVKFESQFCSAHMYDKMPSFATSTETLNFIRFYPRGTMCCICGKLLPSPVSFGGSSNSMLSESQSVSCQYVSRTYSQRTRVCASAYVLHVDRIVLVTRFRDLPRFRYEIIAVRYTKLFLRDSALKYISLISWLPDMI